MPVVTEDGTALVGFRDVADNGDVSVLHQIVTETGEHLHNGMPTPTINRFRTLPPYLALSGGAGAPINFDIDVDDATTTVVTGPDGNVIDTTVSPATTSGTADATYTLRASNVDGDAPLAHWTLIRTVAPGFVGGLTVAYIGQIGGTAGVQYRWQISWRINGTAHPWPTFRWIDPPAGHHLGDPTRATLPDGRGSIFFTGTPGTDPLVVDLHLRATNPLTGETADVTGTLTVPARGG